MGGRPHGANEARQGGCSATGEAPSPSQYGAVVQRGQLSRLDWATSVRYTGNGDRLALAYNRAAVVRAVTRKKATRCCSRYRNPHASETIDVHRSAHGASYRGLMTCDSPWLCPLCTRRRAAQLGAQLGRTMTTAIEQGGACMVGIFTVRHHAGDRLGELLDALIGSWSRMWQSGARRAYLRETFGFVGAVRCVEVTHGANGWHPHIHAVVVTSRRLSREDSAELAELLRLEWDAAVRRVFGRTTSAAANGWRPVRTPAAAASYAFKAAWETVGAGGKDGRRNSRTPFQMLDDMNSGDARALALWDEYEAATTGRRALGVIGRRALAQLGFREEEGDGDVSEEPCLRLTDRDYRAIRQLGAEAAVLRAVDDWRTLTELRGWAATYANAPPSCAQTAEQMHIHRRRLAAILNRAGHETGAT